MAIGVPANCTTVKVEADLNGIAVAVEAALRALSAGDEIFDISYIRSLNSQGVVAIISYEAAP